MKVYTIEGVEGVFLHLETPMEQNVISSLCGRVGGVGEKRNVISDIYYALGAMNNSEITFYEFNKKTYTDINYGKALIFKGEEPA